MAGYLGTKAVLLSTTAATVTGDMTVGGNATISGAATFSGPFTSLGIDDNAAATAMTLDASGNVGIGTAAPSSNVDILGSSSRIRLDGSSSSFQILSRNTADSTTNALTFDADSYTFNRAGSAKAVIDSSGNVGIGTASINHRLSMSGRIEVQDSALGLGFVDNARYPLIFASDSAGPIPFNGHLMMQPRTSAGGAIIMATGSGTAAERMRIDASGNLLVGTTTALASNENSNQGVNLGGSGAAVFARTSGSANLYVSKIGTSGEMIRFVANGADVGSIDTTASATSYSTSSDYRLKENITPVQGAADIVKAMRPVTYNFKADSTDWHDGFLAHELQELHPRAVTGEKDAMRDEEYEVTPAVYEDVIIPAVDAVVDEDGNVTQEAQPERTEQRLVSEAVMGTRSVPEYQGVDYSKLTPILTAALQEALNKIDALEARLTALEATP